MFSVQGVACGRVLGLNEVLTVFGLELMRVWSFGGWGLGFRVLSPRGSGLSHALHIPQVPRSPRALLNLTRS